ncbi:MAG: acyltransferase [Acidobacteria bacterium]|nr:acyltransferase [Acidobacteriota bacterium]
MPLEPLKPPLSPRRILLIVIDVFVWGFLLAFLLAINVIQVASLVVFPVSRRVFRRFNRFLANLWWGACVIVSRHLAGVRVIVTGDEIPERENAIVVVNHQQMTDIMVILDFALRRHRLGDLKFFVKDILKWVPGIGWGMLFLGCPYLKRNWSRDRSSIDRTFRTLVNERIPAWMVIFAEGTRITPAKLARSVAFASRRGFPSPRHVLLPRPRGFAAAVEGLRSHVTAVYDFTIGYTGGVPTLRQYVSGAVARVHLHARRFPMESLPEKKRALEAWLYERFLEKDALLDGFYANGTFPQHGAPAALQVPKDIHSTDE